MQPSEMTNEELAKALMSRVPLDSNNHDDIREASARLRTFTLLSKAHQRLANDSVDYESNLLKKLKAAEDFATEMKESTNSLVRACGHQIILRLQGKGANNGK